jgi:hypothetical protein
VNLDHLQLFVRVVQTGSFTRAADALETQKSYVHDVVVMGQPIQERRGHLGIAKHARPLKKRTRLPC